jgi:hypothetical protein
MAVIVGVLIACALFVTLIGTAFTDIKIFGFYASKGGRCRRKCGDERTG